MDHMEMLHRQERADVHPICDLKCHKAIGKTLLPLELSWNQRAAGQSLSNPLRVLESLDAREH
jgi:hypothetical protein